MTLKEMRDRVVQEIGLQEIQAYDERTLVNGEINRGVLDLLARTRCVVRCMHLRTTAGVDSYVLDHKVMALVEVEDGSMRNRRDEDLTGFRLLRSDVLQIPAPSDDGEVDVWAVVRPTPMVEDVDSPSAEEHGAIPDEFQEAIVTYALWKCSRYADDASGSMGEAYRIDYEGQDKRGGMLREIRMMVNKRGTQRFPRSRSRRLRVVSGRGAWVG
jgi:hypothetical protein